MKISNVNKRFLLALSLSIILAPSLVSADIIYFKDGMKTVCLEKAWEENGEVKCEYDGVVLSYRKNDVDRIEKKRTRQQASKTGEKTANSKASVTSKPGSPSTPANMAEGLRFYDPRRTHKYWTGKNGKHKTFQAAVAALARQYDRPADWIQAHMGETNDLGEIHRNLSTGLAEKQQTPAKAASENINAVEFYNPRRTYKYWTSETARHNTFSEAMAALAREYERTTDWVKRHMGDVNDLHTIRQNLSDRKQQEGAQ